MSDIREVYLVKHFVYYCLKSSTKLISSPTRSDSCVQCLVQLRKVVFPKFAEAHVFILPVVNNKIFSKWLPGKLCVLFQFSCFITTRTVRSSDFNDCFYPLLSSNVSVEHVHIHSANQCPVFVCSLSHKLS